MRRPDDGDEDREQEVALARLEATRLGFDPEAAGREAARRWDAAERRHRLGARPGTDLPSGRGGDPASEALARLGLFDEARKVRSLAPSRLTTEGQRRRAVRDAIILLSELAGFPQRDIGRAFGLPHSRIAAILKKQRSALTGVAPGTHPNAP